MSRLKVFLGVALVGIGAAPHAGGDWRDASLIFMGAILVAINVQVMDFKRAPPQPKGGE